jgi:hypothetical protein
MLLQLLIDRPQAVGTILQNTPTWVWGLLAGLLALGISQMRDRQVSLARSIVMPVAMAVFAVWGIVSAFGAGSVLVWALLAWVAAAASVGWLLAISRPPRGTSYDPATRSYALPGSAVPLLLILGIFLTKYAVGVELAMQPSAGADGNFAVAIAALYGVFNGIFAGRALRLARLAFGRTTCHLANA